MSFQKGFEEFVRASGPDAVGDAEFFAARFRSGEAMYLNLIPADEARINAVLAGGDPPMGITWADWDGESARYWAVRLLSDEEKAEQARAEQAHKNEVKEALAVLHMNAREAAPWRQIGAVVFREWYVRHPDNPSHTLVYGWEFPGEPPHEGVWGGGLDALTSEISQRGASEEEWSQAKCWLSGCGRYPPMAPLVGSPS